MFFQTVVSNFLKQFLFGNDCILALSFPRNKNGRSGEMSKVALKKTTNPNFRLLQLRQPRLHRLLQEKQRFRSDFEMLVRREICLFGRINCLQRL